MVSFTYQNVTLKLYHKNLIFTKGSLSLYQLHLEILYLFVLQITNFLTLQTF